MEENKQNFNLEILNLLANHHKTLMNNLENKIDTFVYDKDIYDYITKYFEENKLVKAFPVGISINQIVAHNSYHQDNRIKLKSGDFIKIDYGLIQESNIIDSARTFVYEGDSTKIKAIRDAEIITKKIEEYIKEEIEMKGIVSIQKISALTHELIVANGYHSLGLIGGHSIEYGKVHGKKLILNKPLNLLPVQAKKFIDENWTLTSDEMFAIEIYLPEHKADGELIQNVNIPITHYEVNSDINGLEKITKEEQEVLDKIKEKTLGLVYEYILNKEFNSKIINSLIKKNYIIKHYPLEFRTKTGKIIKYVQYEDCYLIKDNELINLLD